MKRRVATYLACVGCVLWAHRAAAEVTRVDIKTRADIGTSGYEKLAGEIHFMLDPADPHNRVIVDLDKAPHNAAGRVEFSADVYIVRPKNAERSNGSALVEVVNRGNRRLLRTFNRGGPNPDPSSDADLGDKFLMRFGFTLASVGWEFDVTSDDGLRIHAPVAKDGNREITGIVRAVFTPSERSTEYEVGDLARYDAADPEGADSRLLVRASVLANGEPVARNTWRVRGHTITLDTGFEPGKTYDISYRAANPPVAGVGFAAVRDFGAWLKDPASERPLKYAYAYGSSQSGRFLRDFLYQGFNGDERNRQVFDGVMAHIAGAARVDLNARWATPTALSVHRATAFPFADAAMRDPVSGAVDGLLENSRARAFQPKVFYTNTPVEYWGTGRVAALIHTTPDGTADLELPDNVRVYYFAGTQHSPARFPPRRERGQELENPVEYAWTLRALLLAMHRWVSSGTAPPASAYPTLADRTLVPATAIGFPAIPNVASPAHLSAGPRVANPLIAGGGGAGTLLPLLVPAVDSDGNDRAGVRVPDVAVPLATYTGWNFRHPSIGSPQDLVPLHGASIPFPLTRALRTAAKDPRRSIEERYPSRDEYLAQVEKAADALVLRGYLLYDDVPKVVQRATDTWDTVIGSAR